MSKHLSFSLSVKLFFLSLLLPVLSWGQCVNPADLVDNTLEICQGEVVIFCPEVDEYCWKWLPESAFPTVEETMYNQPTTNPLEEDVVIQLIKTSNEGDLIEELEINVIMKSPDFIVDLEEVYEFCPGGSVTISPVIEGATGDLAYEWSNGETTASITISSEETGGYSVIVNDLTTGCSVIASTSVEVRTIPDFIIKADADFICQEESPGLLPTPPDECESEPTIRLNTSLLDGTYEYEWTDPSGATFESEDLIAEFEGLYQLTVSDTELGCTATAEYFIRSCASVSIDAQVTIEDSEIAFILSAETGEGFTYVWKDDQGNNIGIGEEITVSEPGTYKVEARSPGGCLVEDTYVIQLPCRVPKDNDPNTPDDAYYVYTPGGVGILLPESMPIQFEQSSGNVIALFDETTKKLYNGLTTPFFQGYLYNQNLDDDYENLGGFEGIQNVYQGEIDKIGGECKCRIFRVKLDDPNVTVFATNNGVPNSSDQVVNLNYRPNNPAEVIAQNTSAYHCFNINSGGTFSGNDYMDLIMDNNPGSNIYNESDFLIQLGNVRNYLTEKDQKAAFYYYDRNAGVLRIYGRSDDPNDGIETVFEEPEIQAILAALHSDNLPAGKDFVGVFDRQSVDVIRFEPKFGEGTFKAADGPWPMLDDVEYEEVAGTALKDAFNDLDDASSFVYDPYDESGEVAWDGELRMDDNFGFLKWSTFGFSQLSHLVKNGEIDTKIWNNDPANIAAYNEQPLHIWTSVAGVGDQVAKEYKDLKETVVLVGQVLRKPKETLQPIYQGIKNLTFEQLQKLATQSIQGLQGETAEAQHKRAEAGTGAVMLIFKMSRGGFLKILDEMNEKLNKFLIVVRKFDNVDIAGKLRALPELKAQKFANDFENISDINVNIFRGDPGLIDGWAIISNLPQATRTKMLNIEVTRKLDVIRIWDNPNVIKNKVPRIITSLDGAGADGISILNKIKSGSFDGVDGYDELIKKLVSPSRIKPVKQALDKADEYPNVANNLKKFEFDNQTNIDVDFGILSTPGGPPYSFVEAFQFKFASTPNAVKNGMSNTALSKIDNATSTSKIYQVDMGSGSISNVSNLPNWDSFIAAKKASFPDVEIRIFDSSGGSLIY